MNLVKSSMESCVRMPYVNQWRVTLKQEDLNSSAVTGGDDPDHAPRRIARDCPGCVSTPESGALAAEISDELEKELGVNVYGWDLHWSYDWNTMLYQVSPSPPGPDHANGLMIKPSGLVHVLGQRTSLVPTSDIVKQFTSSLLFMPGAL